jgi:hypothetical protein
MIVPIITSCEDEDNLCKGAKKHLVKDYDASKHYKTNPNTIKENPTAKQMGWSGKWPGNWAIFERN